MIGCRQADAAAVVMFESVPSVYWMDVFAAIEAAKLNALFYPQRSSLGGVADQGKCYRATVNLEAADTLARVGSSTSLSLLSR